MAGLIPSRAAKPALSTLIRAAPPWGGPTADRSWVDGALSGRRRRADASRVPVQIAGTVGEATTARRRPGTTADTTGGKDPRCLAMSPLPCRAPCRPAGHTDFRHGSGHTERPLAEA